MRFRRQFPIVILAWSVILLALAGCNLAGQATGRPQIVIQSPPDGSTVPVGEPIIISAAATDPDGPGITRVEVFADGESITVLESPSGPLDVFDVATTFTPESEGQVILTLIAYRRDGTPSAPATLLLDVVGMTLDPTQTLIPTLTVTRPAETGIVTLVPTAQSGAVLGRVTILANIRSGPGPFCPIIGFADEGDIINLLEYSRNKQWFQTDFLDRVGWIFEESVEVIGDSDQIPVGNRLGCAGCGDNLCNAGETCDDCPEDCGQCCGNTVCEPQYGEDCGTCEGDCGACCGNGTCEAARGEDCGTCAADCGQCCGNGVCEPGRSETCSTCAADCGKCCGNGLCEANFGEDCGTCAADCGQCCGNGLCESGRGETCSTCDDDCGICTPAPRCGDGTCDPGETATSCPADCDTTECGDGTCDPDEDSTTCPADCPAPTCGDGTCDAGEDSTTCPADCPAPTCGDGTCDAGEDSTSCPSDCPTPVRVGQPDWRKHQRRWPVPAMPL